MRGRLARSDVMAVTKFLALFAVLFALPDEKVVLGVNPRRVWFVVVGVAGLSLLGYLLSKVVDPTTAIGAAGMLGGLVSPGMAITSLLEQEHRAPEFASTYALASALAVTMLFPRNLVVVALVDPSLAASLWAPFLAMGGVAAAVSVVAWRGTQGRAAPADELETPFSLRSAFLIGAIVAVLLAIVHHAQLSIPEGTSRLGVVAVTLFEMTVYTAVTASARAFRMARTVGAILVGSALLALPLVVWT